jgi:hypothetical protein
VDVGDLSFRRCATDFLLPLPGFTVTQFDVLCVVSGTQATFRGLLYLNAAISETRGSVYSLRRVDILQEGLLRAARTAHRLSQGRGGRPDSLPGVARQVACDPADALQRVTEGVCHTPDRAAERSHKPTHRSRQATQEVGLALRSSRRRLLTERNVLLRSGRCRVRLLVRHAACQGPLKKIWGAYSVLSTLLC